MFSKLFHYSIRTLIATGICIAYAVAMVPTQFVGL